MIERTRYRYRMCIDCNTSATIMDAPETVITDKSRRKLKEERQAGQIDGMQLLQKKVEIIQNNQFNFQNNNHYINTVWNRDICAARVILQLYKGKNCNNYVKKI